jgi:hypothetical protein
MANQDGASASAAAWLTDKTAEHAMTGHPFREPTAPVGMG